MIRKIILAAMERNRAMIVFLLVILLGGINSYIHIPKEADPDIPVPFIYIGISLPGISPTDSERLIVRPLELELQKLTGVKEIRGIAQQHHGAAIVEFDVSFDKDKALADVREKVNLAKSKFPADADEPEIREFNAALFPVILINLYGNLSERELYQRARLLKDEIESMPDVLEANLLGHREEVLQILLDPIKMESYGISADEIFRVLSRNNQIVPAGEVDSGGGSFSLSISGLIEQESDIANLVLRQDQGAIIQIKDIAEVQRTFKDAKSFARFNGQPTIGIEVVKRLGSNIILTAQAVREKSLAFKADWPDAIKVDFSGDLSSYIYSMIESLELSIINAIILVMILVFGSLGLRSGLLVGFAIPMSFMSSFFLLGIFGFNLNMMIMFGMILSVGILVDGAIVVIEYADRKMTEGLDKREAYAMAIERMFWPLISSTATTMAAFAPLLLWPGITGKFMSFLPLTVIIVLSASLVTAMLFLPVLGGMFGKAAQIGDKNLAALSANSSRGDILHLSGFTGGYLRILYQCIKYSPLTILAAILLLSAIITTYIQNNPGVEFFRTGEAEQTNIFIRARGNISANDALEITQQVEAIVLNTPGIETAFTRTNTADTKVFGGSDMPADTIGWIFVDFAEYYQRDSSRTISSAIVRQANKIPGIIVEAREREDGPPQGKALDVQILGGNLEEIEKTARDLIAYLRSRPDLYTDIDDTLPLPGLEWELEIDREKAGLYNVDIASLGSIVQFISDGWLLAKYRPDDSEDEIDIRVRFPENYRSLDKLDELRIATPYGDVPISSFVTRVASPRLSSINRLDSYRYYRVIADTIIDPATGQKILPQKALADFEAWRASHPVPPGIQFRLGGSNDEEEQTAAFLSVAFIGSLALMFVILLLQFNSFFATFLTLSTVTLSTVGVLFGILVTGQNFGMMMTGTGIVALAGIIVNNSIVLIDTFQRLLATGYNEVDAILRAAGQRLRPILLTTLTTMIGMFPLAIGLSVDVGDRFFSFGDPKAVLWIQLSTAIIFGLGFSTLLTLVLVPVMLSIPQQIRLLKERFLSSLIRR